MKRASCTHGFEYLKVLLPVMIREMLAPMSHLDHKGEGDPLLRLGVRAHVVTVSIACKSVTCAHLFRK